MKTLAPAVLIALSMLSAGAQAGAPAYDATRAQVVAELQQAKAAGLITYGEDQYPVQVADNPGLTRTEVRAQLQHAKDLGLLTYGEDQYPVAVHS